MLPAIWLLLYEGVKTYSSLYSVFFNIPCHLAVLINGVTLPGDGFPIQRVVMNILQLIESRKPAASCSPQLSVWIKKHSRPYEPRYHGFARMIIKCLQPYILKTRIAKRPLRNLGLDGRVLRKWGNAGCVVLVEHSQWVPFVDMLVDSWVAWNVENIWITWETTILW
jgi:hypothetical protein